MKTFKKAVAIFCLMTMCMVQVAEAADPRAVAMAQTLTAMDTESGKESVVSCFVKKEEAMELYSETKRILFCISPGYSPATRGTKTVKVPKGISGEYVKVRIYVSHEEVGLANDPRICAELEVLNSLGTFEEKVREINRFVSAAAYDNDYNATSGVNLASATALGCLNGLAICQGYSNLASYLYDASGIKNIKVWCSVKDQGEHMCNMVRNDGRVSYVVDSTFTHAGEDCALLSLDEYQNRYNVTLRCEPELLFDLRYPAPAVVEPLVESN